MSKRLGKGLEALLGTTTIKSMEDGLAGEVKRGLLEVDIKQLEPGRYQPRGIMREAELAELADSIRMQGIIQPILVRSKSEDKYEIIAGERRWRAAQLAGLSTVPVVIKEVTDEKELAILALIENIQRENLSPLEEAQALERMAEEFGLTHQQVAQAVGKTRVSVTQLLRLLTLPEEIKQMLESGTLEVGHAKALLGLKGSAQAQVAKIVVSKGLSVRETERMIARIQAAVSPATSRKRKIKDPDVQRLELTLSERLGAAVEIVQEEKGKGRLIIQYNSLEELEGILAHIEGAKSD